MKRSPTRTARPAIPPATPPAIAAAFDFDAGAAVDMTAGLVGASWPAVVAAATLYTREVGVVKICECLVEGLLALDVAAAVVDWTRLRTSEKGPEV